MAAEFILCVSFISLRLVTVELFVQNLILLNRSLHSLEAIIKKGMKSSSIQLMKFITTRGIEKLFEKKRVVVKMD